MTSQACDAVLVVAVEVIFQLVRLVEALVADLTSVPVVVRVFVHVVIETLCRACKQIQCTTSMLCASSHKHSFPPPSTVSFLSFI